MFQIVFNELSAGEMAALPKDLQLDLLAEFEVLPDNLDDLDPDRFGVLERDRKKLYRYRAKDHRIYFERVEEGIVVHRVLHKNSLRDFMFRSKLPVAEDEQLSKKDEFWKLIEAGEKAREKAMKGGLLICIVVVVAIAHLALFQIIDQMRKFGQPKPAPPPEPSFTTTTFRYRNDRGQDVKVVQEFKVSTQFADPKVLETLPPPPPTAKR